MTQVYHKGVQEGISQSFGNLSHLVSDWSDRMDQNRSDFKLISSDLNRNYEQIYTLPILRTDSKIMTELRVLVPTKLTRTNRRHQNTMNITYFSLQLTLIVVIIYLLSAVLGSDRLLL